MYEVFLNDRRIQIVDQSELTLIKGGKVVPFPAAVSDLRNWLREVENGDEQMLVLVSENSHHFFHNRFRPCFTQIEAAGGLVFRDTSLLFIRKDDRWDLPKGKIDPGECQQDAAIREVGEECGISGISVVTKLSSTYHLYRSPYPENKGDWILKETHWFEMSYPGESDGSPQLEENITALGWISKTKLKDVIQQTYANLRPILMPYLC